MSRSKGGLSDALFDTSEGEVLEGGSAGTQVLPGLVSEEATLVVESGPHAGERVLLGASTCVIGRSTKCALVLRRSAGVSRRHSKVTYVGGTYEISDCGSRNGTRVNGREVSADFPLNDGDLIELSDERIRFRGPSGRRADDDSRLPEAAPLEPPSPDAAPSRAPQPSPIVRSPSVLSAEPASREPPRGALSALGVALGLAVLVGGVAGGDLLLNDGRLTMALVEDVERLFAANEVPPVEPEAPKSEPTEEAPEREPPRVPSDEEPAAANSEESKPTSVENAPVVEVKAGLVGRVRSVAVSKDAVVRRGETLLVVERSLSGSAARKLRALRREEAAFAEAAAAGDARAQEDLAGVRREIARLERRQGAGEVKADVGGRVERVLVDVGESVKADDVVVRLRESP